MADQFHTRYVVDFLLKNPIPPGGKHILLACFPKSGSTRVANVFGHLPGFGVSYVAPDGHAEQIPRTEMLVLLQERNWIAQHHVGWSEHLQDQIDAFQLVPVVLVRNLFDVVRSLHDHLHQESVVMPMAWVEPRHLELSDEDSWEFITDMILPWYFRFLISWQKAQVQPLWLRYEEMVEDPLRLIQRIAERAALPFSTEQLRAALTVADVKPVHFTRGTRLNVGKVGRGAELPDRIKDRIRKMASYYPNADLSMIGL